METIHISAWVFGIITTLTPTLIILLSVYFTKQMKAFKGEHSDLMNHMKEDAQRNIAHDAYHAKNTEKHELIEEALQKLIDSDMRGSKARIKKMHKRFMISGGITVNELDIFKGECETYIAAGGNGVVIPKLQEDIMNLEIELEGEY